MCKNSSETRVMSHMCYYFAQPSCAFKHGVHNKNGSLYHSVPQRRLLLCGINCIIAYLTKPILFSPWL